MTSDRNSDKTCFIFFLKFLQSRDWVKGEWVQTPTLQKSQLLKFYWLFIRVSRGKVLTFEVFQQFYQTSHNDSKGIILTHNYGYFELSGKNVVFEQK